MYFGAKHTDWSFSGHTDFIYLFINQSKIFACASNRLLFSNCSHKGISLSLSLSFIIKLSHGCLKIVLRICLKTACRPTGRPGGDWMGPGGPSEHLKRSSCTFAACDRGGTCYWTRATRMPRVQLQWMGPTRGGDRGSCWKRSCASFHCGSKSKWGKLLDRAPAGDCKDKIKITIQTETSNRVTFWFGFF